MRRAQAAAVVLGVIALSATAVVAEGDPVEAVSIEDVAGDANGVNTQGETGVGTLDVPTDPGQVADADLRTITFTPRTEVVNGRPVKTGVEVAVVVTGRAGSDLVQLTIGGRAGGCERIVIVHDPQPELDEAPTRFSATCAGDEHTGVLAAPDVDGSTLTLHLPDEILAEALQPGDRLTDIWIATGNAVGAAVSYDTASGGPQSVALRSEAPAEETPPASHYRRG